MTRLIIVVDVSDDVDPQRIDPWEIAEVMVDEHTSYQEANGYPARVTFVSAEWDV